MLTEQYYSGTNGKVRFTRKQGSDFAKKIADDFNPLHDEDSKRFCVPGDLLFSLILAKYGITKHMRFTFSGMVTEDVELILPEESPLLSMQDANGKEYMSVEHTGDNSRDDTLIDTLTRNYVTFSGHTFPHILVPLLEEKGVMINPTRPMVMYQSMLIDMDRLDISSVELELNKEKTIMDVNGKRGNICLAFNLVSEGEIVGRGEKHMLLSGLMPYDKEAMDRVIRGYAKLKEQFNA